MFGIPSGSEQKVLQMGVQLVGYILPIFVAWFNAQQKTFDNALTPAETAVLNKLIQGIVAELGHLNPAQPAVPLVSPNGK